MKKDKNKNKAELIAELDILRSQRRASIMAPVLNNAIMWTGIVAVVFMAHLSIKALAGETTDANIVVDFMASATFSMTISVSFGAFGTIYGLRQRSLRRSTTGRQEGRIRELEELIDSKRSSSGLQKDGRTNPKDT